MSAPTTTDLDGFRVLGAATSRAFADGTLDSDGLAQVRRHVLDRDLDRAWGVLGSAPKTAIAQCI